MQMNLHVATMAPRCSALSAFPDFLLCLYDLNRLESITTNDGENLRTDFTFCIASSGHQIVQSTVITCYCTFFTQTTRFDEIPNECFYLLIALIALQAKQKLQMKNSKLSEKCFFQFDFKSTSLEITSET